MTQAANVQASNLENLNNLYQMQSLLVNMQTNVYLVSQGANGQIIQISNANLFQLAAQYYGDATLWTAIAEANGLTDPVVQATLNLSLNSINPNQIIVGGFVQPNQIAEIAITLFGGTKNYTYTMTVQDTIYTVATKLGALIPSAVVVNNIITVVDYLSINLNVYRFLSLTIPQNTPDQGGILNV